jgi:FKBP-type peptidyl-prolyl cis-trans isomerase SlyD
MELMAEDPQGQAVPFVIHEVKPESVVIDLNHPLAGRTLHFAVTIRDVRAATADELEHGHVHGPHGHDHDD